MIKVHIDDEPFVMKRTVYEPALKDRKYADDGLAIHGTMEADAGSPGGPITIWFSIVEMKKMIEAVDAYRQAWKEE